MKVLVRTHTKTVIQVFNFSPNFSEDSIFAAPMEETPHSHERYRWANLPRLKHFPQEYLVRTYLYYSLLYILRV